MSTPSMRPNVATQPWLSQRVPVGYWERHHHCSAYMDWLGGCLGYVCPTCWYGVKNRDFIDNHGGTLLKSIYGSSVLQAVEDYMPEEDWKPWLFAKTPAGFWNDAANRRRFMKWFEVEIGIDSRDDWYDVTERDFARLGGASLIVNYYSGSILEAVREYRPKVAWKPWLFPKVPNGYWSHRENRLAYYAWLGKRMGYRTKSDWRRLTKETVYENRGSHLVEGHFSGAMSALIVEAAR